MWTNQVNWRMIKIKHIQHTIQTWSVIRKYSCFMGCMFCIHACNIKLLFSTTIAKARYHLFFHKLNRLVCEKCLQSAVLKRNQLWKHEYTIQTQKKCPFCHIWATKAMIRLRICAVWSWPSLPAHTRRILISLHACTGLYVSPLSVYCIRALFWVPRLVYYYAWDKNQPWNIDYFDIILWPNVVL